MVLCELAYLLIWILQVEKVHTTQTQNHTITKKTRHTNKTMRVVNSTKSKSVCECFHYVNIWLHIHFSIVQLRDIHITHMLLLFLYFYSLLLERNNNKEHLIATESIQSEQLFSCLWSVDLILVGVLLATWQYYHSTSKAK